MADLLRANKFHNVQIIMDQEEGATVGQFTGLITELQEAMETRFAESGDTDHLNWIGFLNLYNWPIQQSERAGKIKTSHGQE